MLHGKDPVTLEILWRRLISIVDEADAAVARTAFSSLLRDAHDYTCMFTDRRGRELAQGSFATPGQSGAMALGIKKLVQGFPAGSFQPGDVFITNDPWALAGHLNDVCVLSPIFYLDRLVGFTAYDRYRLSPGTAFSGPAIIEERESTVIVDEQVQVRVDDFGFLWIERVEESVSSGRQFATAVSGSDS